MKTESAFSLVEVMVAILILGVALIGLTQGLNTALGSGKESELQSTAALIAAGRIELLRAEGYLEDGETDGDCGTGLELYRWTQTISPAGLDGLHEVVVVIESNRDGKPIYELKTLLFEIPDQEQPSEPRKTAGENGGRK